MHSPRAVSKPKIIILDDSTSAVDTATDAAIRKALSEELSSTTTIIIAQRIASVMDADRIVIMNEGKIDDVGTHAELMQRSEIYREVYLFPAEGGGGIMPGPRKQSICKAKERQRHIQAHTEIL